MGNTNERIKTVKAAAMITMYLVVSVFLMVYALVGELPTATRVYALVLGGVVFLLLGTVAAVALSDWWRNRNRRRTYSEALCAGWWRK